MVDPTAPPADPTDGSDQPDAPPAGAWARPAAGRTIRANTAGTATR
ncbi:hypothetical protein ACN268_19895 [Micromonospora sp. WMMD735]